MSFDAASSKKLVGVTKKLASGGLHTKFRSSSSDSDSLSSSDSSSSDSSHIPMKEQAVIKLKKTPPSRTLSQWDVKGPKPKKPPQSRTSVHPTIREPAGSVKKGGKSSVVVVDKKKGSGRIRKKSLNRRNIPSVVGGPSDTLVTKSVVCTGPLLGEVKKVADLAGWKKGNARPPRGKKLYKCAGLEKKNSGNSAKEEAGLEPVSSKGENGNPSHSAGSEMSAGGEGNGGTNEDVKSSGGMEGELGGSPAADDVEVVEVTKDYSSFPFLQGPPRIGDKLAFKVSFSMY